MKLSGYSRHYGLYRKVIDGLSIQVRFKPPNGYPCERFLVLFMAHGVIASWLSDEPFRLGGVIVYSESVRERDHFIGIPMEYQKVSEARYVVGDIEWAVA